MRKKNTRTTSTITNKSWETAAQDYISKSEYFFKQISNDHAVANRKQKLSFVINETGITTNSINFGSLKDEKLWSFTMKLMKIDKGEMPLNSELQHILQTDNYLKYSYTNYDVEYINNEAGLRQNFIVNKKPGGEEHLQITIKVAGTVTASTQNNALTIKDNATKKTVLHYDGLKVWDAHNTLLTASMQTVDGDMIIKVDDATATYPITIDPLTHSPEWVSSADGVLPGLLNNLQLQVDALYGYSLAGVGDVNGDGYDDVAIGAPAAIDVLNGPVTVAGAGAVFVYFGSANGLPVTPSRVLRATTPVANALFGFSIAGGNVSGSTTAGSVKNDIIVGAPGESYSTVTSGLPSSATVTAGKVYVFDGAQLGSRHR